MLMMFASLTYKVWLYFTLFAFVFVQKLLRPSRASTHCYMDVRANERDKTMGTIAWWLTGQPLYIYSRIYSTYGHILYIYAYILLSWVLMMGIYIPKYEYNLQICVIIVNHFRTILYIWSLQKYFREHATSGLHCILLYT